MEQKGLVMNQINLYVIEKYSTFEADMEKCTFNYDDFDSKKFKKRLNKELLEDKSLHLKYDSRYDCLAFGDVDHCETEAKVIEILKYICSSYEVEFSDLSYTLSNPESDDYGSHWTIPKIQTNIKSLKIQMKEVSNKFNTNIKKYVDSSVYKVEGWLRLPYQTNTKKKTIHSIIQGKPIDFLVHYIDDAVFTYYKEEEEKAYPISNKVYEPNFKLLDALSVEFHSGYIPNGVIWLFI